MSLKDYQKPQHCTAVYMRKDFTTLESYRGNNCFILHCNDLEVNSSNLCQHCALLDNVAFYCLLIEMNGVATFLVSVGTRPKSVLCHSREFEAANVPTLRQL